MPCSNGFTTGFRLLTNFLLSKRAPQTTAVQESQFDPSIVHEARFARPAETEIVQEVVDLASGSRMERVSNSFAANVVLAGEVTYTIGVEQKDLTTYLLPTGSSR